MNSVGAIQDPSTFFAAVKRSARKTTECSLLLTPRDHRKFLRRLRANIPMRSDQKPCPNTVLFGTGVAVQKI
jgi:hypothetical protein